MGMMALRMFVWVSVSVGGILCVSGRIDSSVHMLLCRLCLRATSILLLLFLLSFVFQGVLVRHDSISIVVMLVSVVVLFGLLLIWFSVFRYL